MKILHLLGTNKFSGAENVACQIISMFSDDEGCEMVYCSRDGGIRKALLDRNVSFKPIASLSVNELRRIINEEKPDIIHAHDMRATFIAARAFKNISIISHIHGNSADSHGINARTLAYLWASKRAKHIIWVSQSSLDGYKFNLSVSKKSTVLGNVVSVSDIAKKVESDTSEYNYDLIFVGRFVEEKNPLRFLDIVKKVVENRPDIRACMLGDGPLWDSVVAKIRDLGLSDNIDLLGYVENPMKIVKSSSVMLISSVSEGLPMCALEALALGVPIVSTPTDGLNYVINDGYNGYLSNDDRELTKRVLEIIADPEKRRELSLNAEASSAEINNTERYKAMLGEIYKNALA